MKEKGGRHKRQPTAATGGQPPLAEAEVARVLLVGGGGRKHRKRERVFGYFIYHIS